MDNQLASMSPAMLEELQLLSQQYMADEVVVPAGEMMAAGAVAATPQSVTLIPNPPGVKDIKNWCGQAAVTAVVAAWGKNKFTGRDALQLLLDDVYKWFPPDILHGTFGTSANRIVSALQAHGLRNTYKMQLEPWIPGGFTNPVNLATFNAYKMPIEALVNSGRPVIVMVDNGKLGDDWFVAHWMVMHKAQGNAVHCCNAVNKQQQFYHNQAFNATIFHQAWETAFLTLPGFRFNVVVPLP